MLEYICGSIIGAYYISFCVALAYTIYKERRNERLVRIREYENLSNVDIRLEMFLEGEVTSSRLESIIEVDET